MNTGDFAIYKDRAVVVLGVKDGTADIRYILNSNVGIANLNELEVFTSERQKDIGVQYLDFLNKHRKEAKDGQRYLSINLSKRDLTLYSNFYENKEGFAEKLMDVTESNNLFVCLYVWDLVENRMVYVCSNMQPTIYLEAKCNASSRS